MRIFWYWPFARPEEIDWAREVAARGHQVVVQTVDRAAAPTPEHSDGLTILRDLPDVDRSVGGVAWAASRARTYLDRSRRRRSQVRGRAWDVIHFHYLNRFTDAWTRPGPTWVVSVHDVLPHVLRLGRLEHRLLQRVYDRPDGLVVHHDWIRDALRDEFALHEDRIRVVPHQVFPVDAPTPRVTSNSEAPTVLFFGALRTNKGLDVAIDAIRRMPQSDVSLHIAGRGDPRVEQAALRAAADAPNITAEIGYISTERKDELFRSCAAVVLPYRTFTSQSGVLHDAYGHWRPVVVTDVGALGPTVLGDRTGVVVEPGSADDLVRGLTEVLGPAGDAFASSAQSVARLRSPDRIARATLDAYAHFGAPA